jgi:hypothetical protein
VEDEKRHVERGLVVLGDLLDSAEAHRRASNWQSHLEELLAAAGGVTGFEEDEDGASRKMGRS